MILVDSQQIFLANLFAGLKYLPEISEESLRKVILRSLLEIKKKFSKEYGELVICADSRKNWRKDLFKHYKAHRKANREKQEKVDWSIVFPAFETVLQELDKYFPYKVVRVDKCEADDIIGVICKFESENTKATPGELFEESEPILIISSDRDFIQLHKYEGVRQWSNIQSKFVKADVNPIHDLAVKILKGDKGDGVPNILSADDVFTLDGVRQTPVSKKRINTLLESDSVLDTLKSENMTFARNWKRNQIMIDLEQIPQNYINNIIEEYTAKEFGDKSKLFDYFFRMNLNTYMEDIELF